MAAATKEAQSKPVPKHANKCFVMRHDGAVVVHCICGLQGMEEELLRLRSTTRYALQVLDEAASARSMVALRNAVQRAALHLMDGIQ